MTRRSGSIFSLGGPGELSYRALMDWIEKKKPGTERRLLNTGA